MKKFSALAAASGLIAVTAISLGAVQASAAGHLPRCSSSSEHCVIISNRNGNGFTPCIQAFGAGGRTLSANDCAHIALNSVRRTAMPKGTTTVTVDDKAGHLGGFSFDKEHKDRCFRYASDTLHEAEWQPCSRS